MTENRFKTQSEINLQNTPRGGCRFVKIAQNFAYNQEVKKFKLQYRRCHAGFGYQIHSQSQTRALLSLTLLKWSTLSFCEFSTHFLTNWRKRVFPKGFLTNFNEFFQRIPLPNWTKWVFPKDFPAKLMNFEFMSFSKGFPYQIEQNGKFQWVFPKDFSTKLINFEFLWVFPTDFLTKLNKLSFSKGFSLIFWKK